MKPQPNAWRCADGSRDRLQGNRIDADKLAAAAGSRLS